MKFSNEDCRILRAMAHDPNIRRDFDKLRELRREPDAQVTPGQCIEFLTFCAQWFGPYKPREPMHYPNARL